MHSAIFTPRTEASKAGGRPRLRHFTNAVKMAGIEDMLAAYPELRGVRIETGAPVIGGFAPSTDTIAVATEDPAVMAHELAHAVNLRRSVLYRKLLHLTDAMSRINRRVASTTANLVDTVVSNEQKKNDILNTMSGVSAMLAAPRLVEELNASTNALSWLGNDPAAAQKMRSALGAYVRQALEPVAIYQAAR